jgi:hypothetical protein
MFDHIVELCERFLCGDTIDEFIGRELNMVVDSNIKCKSEIVPTLVYNIKDRCTILSSGADFIETEVSVPGESNEFELIKLRLSLGGKVWHKYEPMVIYWSSALSSIHMKETVKAIERQMRSSKFKIWLYVYSMVLHGLKDLQEMVEKKGLVIEEIKL